MTQKTLKSYNTDDGRFHISLKGKNAVPGRLSGARYSLEVSIGEEASFRNMIGDGSFTYDEIESTSETEALSELKAMASDGDTIRLDEIITVYDDMCFERYFALVNQGGCGYRLAKVTYLRQGAR